MGRWTQCGVWWMACLCGLPLTAAGQEPPSPMAVDFNRHVRPILSEYCFACHGPDAAQRQAELRLDTRDGALAVRDGRAAIRPGHPEQSELLRRLSATDAEERMPPASTGKSLSPQQIDVLRRWIAAGAEWQNHWAFLAPQRPASPAVKSLEWCRNEIDRFVLARLEQDRLSPSPVAERATWLRRVTLDLTGLPPSPSDVAAFLADTSPLADERVVDRLLASPRYGERMALDWLDAARFAETNGYFSDLERPMWPWRDGIIAALNANQPFDQFTIEQLAGDLLPSPTTAQLVASGFHRNQPVTNETGIIDEEYRVEYVAERADTTAAIWLGLTAGCARCHDHKFDPWSQREYYQFFAFFNQGPETGLVHANAPPPALSVSSPEQQARLTMLREQQAECERTFAEHEPALKMALAEWEQTAEGMLPALPADELRAHFDFEQRLTDAVDARALIALGDPAYQPGMLGQALSFANGRHVETAGALPWNSDEPWSVSVWLRFAGPSSVACLLSCLEEDGDRRGWDVIWRKGHLIVNLVSRWGSDALEVWTTEGAKADRWHHLVVSYDGSGRGAGVQIYVDGRPQTLRIERDALTGTTRQREPLRLGRRDSGFGFHGVLDELRCYARVLAPEEVAGLYRSELMRSIVRTPSDQRSELQRELLQEDFLAHQGTAAARDAWTRRHRTRQALKELEAAIPVVMVAQERSEPRETFVLERGQYDHPGERVSADVPGVLPRWPEEAPRNRLGLARWLVDGRNPLTARVIVNRAWQQFFGAGLVRTANDFGAQGEPPTHPELLDWLATEFVRTGWDVKALQRTIVTSATYRQSSSATPEQWAADPENRRLARGPRFRLPAELLRDQALAASGLLVEELGGPSVKPYQPPGLWEAVSYGAEESYVADHGGLLYRRGLYTYWKRQVPPPSLLTFDAPTRETCVVQRARTNTPLQALVLLNDETYVEAARELAERMLEAGGNDTAACVRQGVLCMLGRPPLPQEIDQLTALWQRRRREFRTQPGAALALLNVGDSRADVRFDAADLAAWTVVAGVLLNLDEAVTKP
jgi:hypothetical protein